MSSRPIHGFSLIELMSVISIISILTVVAIPSYQSYTQRARFAEVISSTETFKLAVAIALQQSIPMAELINGAHGIPESPKPSRNLTKVTVQQGVITAIGSEAVNQASYILKPSADGSHWSVSGTCLKSGLCHA